MRTVNKPYFSFPYILTYMNITKKCKLKKTTTVAKTLTFVKMKKINPFNLSNI